MKTYKKGQAVQLSPNFRSTEFDCHGNKCCKDTPIDERLVDVLQNVRDHFGKSVNVNCGYRCPKHNAQVSGASKVSQHMRGMAADIHIKGVHPYRIARYVSTIITFAGRIGCYTWGGNNGFVHIDVRGANSKGIYTEGNVYCDAVASFDQIVCLGSRGRVVKVVQRFLKEQKDADGKKLYKGSIDGKCGNGTNEAIIKWNDLHGRTSNVWDLQCWEESFPK